MEGEGDKDVEAPSQKMSTCQQQRIGALTLTLKGTHHLGPKCLSNLMT